MLLELGPPKQTAVLAVLLISANQVVSLDRLIEMLWGREVPARAQGTLQAYIHNLRKVLEPGRAVRSQAQILVTKPPGYVLQVNPDELDASRFESLAARGHRLLAQAHPGRAKEHLAEALALWRGPALVEFAFEHFAQPEAARLEEARTVVHEDLLGAELALGNHATVVGDISLAVGEHPLREGLWSLLMLALYRSGRQGEALRAFAEARQTLAEELGIDPSPALRSLEAAILAQSPELDLFGEEFRITAHPKSRPASAPPVESGPHPVALVGREDQLRVLMNAMSRAQLGCGGVVLISGEAGIGKSRLAEEVAAEAERNDCPVAWGRSYEREGAPPYWPWMQVAEDLLRQTDPDLCSGALAGRAGALRPLLSETEGLAEDTAATRSDSPSARFALFEAMTGFLVKLAEAGLLVVILEDLQWADPLSLRLLEHMAARLQSGHVLVVATCRPPQHYRKVPLTDSVGALARLPVFHWIELDGLDGNEVGRLIAETGARASPAEVREIHSRTDGNPFFVTDFARLLATRDGPNPCHPGLIPNNARVVIQSRLRRLPDRTYNLLVVAAAMGRDFDIRTVAAATGTNLNDAVDWMHCAVLEGLVTEDTMSPGSYRFGYGLVRDTLRCELGGLRQSSFHALANLPGDDRDESGGHRSDSQQAYG